MVCLLFYITDDNMKVYITVGMTHQFNLLVSYSLVEILADFTPTCFFFLFKSRHLENDPKMSNVRMGII